MEQAKEEELGVISSLAAGVTANVGNILPERCRTLAVTCRVTYHASATAGVTLKLFYVHEDIGEDTVAFTSFTPTLSAGNTVQRTCLIDVPEGGSFVVKVKNDDGTYAATNIIVGYSLVRWKDYQKTEEFQGKVVKSLQ